MGDRGILRVMFDDYHGVDLYTHWSGSSMHHDLQQALAKKWRWDDAPYLTRIIFDELTKNSHGEETGFGIGPIGISGEDYTLIIVDVPRQTVELRNMWKSYTFTEFIQEKFVNE